MRVEVIVVNYPIVVRDRPVEPIVEHEIRLRAYDLFLQRGRADGHALEDWLKAEHEIVRQIEPFLWKVS